MSEKSVEKYIEIVSDGQSPSGLTKRWKVLNKREGAKVGVIKWYGGFRKYCFFPEDDTLLYDADCLRMISNYLDAVNLQAWGQRKADRIVARALERGTKTHYV